MPDEETINQQLQEQGEPAPDQSTPPPVEDILPDESVSEDAEQKQQPASQQDTQLLEKLDKQYKDQIEALRHEKEVMEKRMQDAQNRMHQLTDERSQAQPKQDAPSSASLDAYIKELEAACENDGPAAAIRKFASDYAFDRDQMLKQVTGQIQAQSEAAYQRALRANPEQAELIERVEQLEIQKPQYRALPFEVKMEIANLQKKLDKQDEIRDNRSIVANSAAEDRGMLPSTSARRQKDDGSRIPSWANDLEIQKAAASDYRSKKELVDWANVKSVEEAESLLRKQQS